MLTVASYLVPIRVKHVIRNHSIFTKRAEKQSKTEKWVLDSSVLAAFLVGTVK